MGKQKNPEYEALAEQIRPLLPASIDELVIQLNSDKRTIQYVMRHFVGNEHLSEDKPDVSGPLWGQSPDDYFL